MTWFDTADRCRLWAGPNFVYPFDDASFLRDLQWTSRHSFSLVDDDDALLGFGQLHDRFRRIHLSRLAIAPDRRGRGLGKTLLRDLIRAGESRFGYDECALYVYEHNVAAVACYSALGFKPVAPPERVAGLEECLYMVRGTTSL